jgi:hypothetical protein
MSLWVAVDAQGGGVEARNGAVEGLETIIADLLYYMMKSRIRIRIKVKNRIRIRSYHIKVKRRIRIRSSVSDSQHWSDV